MKTVQALSSEILISKKWLSSDCKATDVNCELANTNSDTSFLFCFKIKEMSDLKCFTTGDFDTNDREITSCNTLSLKQKDFVKINYKIGEIILALSLSELNSLQIFSSANVKIGNKIYSVACFGPVPRNSIVSKTIQCILNCPREEVRLQTLCQSMLKLCINSNVCLYSPVRIGKSLCIKGSAPDVNGKGAIADSTHLIAVVFGWSGQKPAGSIETFNGNSQKWFFFEQKANITRAYHGVAHLGGYLYVVGGFDGRTCVASTLCFNVRSREWSRKPSMAVPRCYLLTVVCRGEVYAIGGHSGDRRLKTCEKFDPKRNRWFRVTGMMYRRSDAAGCVLNGKILVSGGFDGFQLHSSAEIYDPTTNQWSLVGSLLSSRSGHCLINCDGQVFALGGFNGVERMRQVEKFDEKRNQWENCVPMLDRRSNFCCTVFQENIYVIGGYDGRTTMSSVEKFDMSCMEWQRAPSLNTHRSAAGACVIKSRESISSCAVKELAPVVSTNTEESSP